MIDLKSLVKSVQVASQSAVEAIASENLKIFNTYFECTDEEGQSNVKKKKLNSMENDDVMGMISNFSSAEGVRYKPRMITIQYPVETARGPEIQDVYVPLLTLMPIAMPQLSELKFSTDLELALDDDAPNNIRVSFPAKQKNKPFLKQNKQNEPPDEKAKAKLEVVINSENVSDGLQKIIEGYEKALRAQIPM